MSELAGKVAVITGGGRGLGRAFAVSLAHAGMSVAILARSSEQLAVTASMIPPGAGRLLCLTADITAPDAVRRAAEQIGRTLGPVDLLVNNAGVAGPCGPSASLDAADWWHCVETNLRGAFLCSHAVLPSMIERRSGRIVNVASGAGCFPVPYLSAYAVSKAALIRLTETLALEIRSYGLSVFSIHPGTVRTAMCEGLLASPAAQQWIPWFGEAVELGGAVSVDSAVDLVLFLAKGFADRLSGRLFMVPEDPRDLVDRAAEIEAQDLYTLRLRGLF